MKPTWESIHMIRHSRRHLGIVHHGVHCVHRPGRSLAHSGHARVHLGIHLLIWIAIVAHRTGRPLGLLLLLGIAALLRWVALLWEALLLEIVLTKITAKVALVRVALLGRVHRTVWVLLGIVAHHILLGHARLLGLALLIHHAHLVLILKVLLIIGELILIAILLIVRHSVKKG